MTTKQPLLAAGLIGVAAALAAPAVAAAHPAVYAQTAKVNVAPAGAPAVYADQERYVVANHGFTYVLRESNGRGPGDGALARGVITYGKAAGRAKSAGFLDTDAARTGVQAHATCDLPALTSEAVVRSWQGATVEDAGEPFYAYVPFQTGSAGLEDDPATWLPVVRSATGIDLRTVADTDEARKAACEGKGGTYYPADAVQSSNASFNSGLITAISSPLKTRIATLEETLAAAQATQAGTDAELAAAHARLAQAPAPSVARPLAAKLASTSFTPAAVASSGVPVDVTGPAGQAVRVRATVPASAVRRQRLRSTVLGSKGGVVGRDGTARLVVKPSASQAKALKAIRTGALRVTLELVVATTRATVAR